MKRIVLLFVIAVTVLTATACGGSATTQAPAQPAATEAPAQQPAATEPPAQQPATTEAPASSAGATKVNIILTDNRIESSLTDFQVGVPYTFVISNAGRHNHNFNINTPVSVAGSLEGALSTALLAVDEDQLAAGDSVTVEYTFPDVTAGTQLEFSCLIRRHYDDGMKLAITVTK